MALNVSEARTVFQNKLDQQMVEELTSGFMEKNAGEVIYEGGSEIKIPSINMDGLKDYSRTNGYPSGGVSMKYQTVKMTMDRSESFVLDAMDVEETNFLASASVILGEFQRTKVVPEVDAYRYSKIYEMVKAGAAANVRTEAAALTEKTIYKSLVDDIAAVRDEIGESANLVIVMTGKMRGLLNNNDAFTKTLSQVDFTKGDITTKIRAIDDCPIIGVPSARMQTEYDFFKGTETPTPKHGFEKKSTAKQINYIVLPDKAAIAVCKQDKPKILDPDTYQRADAWFIGYRKYHDLWVKESHLKAIRISVAA